MKNKKKINLLIFSHNNNYNIKIFKNISENIKKKIKVKNIITVDKNNLDKLQKTFFDCQIILRNDLIRNEKSKNKSFKYNNSKKYTRCKNLFYKMLDFVRKDENDFTKKEKNEAFNYFSKVISNYIFLNKIDVVFFSHVPHNFFDVLFIQICELNKIKVIFTRSYLLPGFYLFEI